MDVLVIQNHNESRPMFLHLAQAAPHAGNDGGLLQPPLFSTVKNQHIAHSDRRLYAGTYFNSYLKFLLCSLTIKI